MILEMIAVGFASAASPLMHTAAAVSVAEKQIEQTYAPPRRNQRQRRLEVAPQPIIPPPGKAMPPTIRDYVLQHNKSLKRYFTHGQIYELDRTSSYGDLSEAADTIIVMDRLGGSGKNSFQQLYLPVNVDGKDILPLALVEYHVVVTNIIIDSYAVKNYRAQFTDYSKDLTTLHIRMIAQRRGDKSVTLSYSNSSGKKATAAWKDHTVLVYKATGRKGAASQFDISCIYMKCPFYTQKDPAKTKLQPWRFAPPTLDQLSPTGGGGASRIQRRYRRVTIDK